MLKLSFRHFAPLIRLSKRDEEKIIEEIRKRVKDDSSVQDKFKEYGVPLNKIDSVHISFEELDVSAKTKDKKIYLNEDMLKPDSKIKDPGMYVCHEIIHFLQQTTGKNMDKHHEEDEYLEKETEVEAFSVQEDYLEDTQGEEAAEEYISGLLDYHDYKGKKREDKKEEIMGG